MSFENRHIFKGKINNKNIYDYIVLDYSINSLEERKKYIEDILYNKGGQEFFSEYFDDYFKSEINQYDELSEQNNICKVLENMGNYLLGSDEIREDRKSDEQQYRFFVDRNEFSLRTKKEESLDGKINYTNSKIDNNNLNNSDNIIDFLLSNNKNNKKSKKQVITDSDLNQNDYCGEVLKDYQSLVDIVNKELINPTKFKGKRYKLTKMKSELMFDMIYCKNHIRGVFGEKPKNLLNGYSSPSWDKFDFTNKEHMKKLIYIQNEFEPDNDISYLLMDLESLMSTCYEDGIFTDKEYKTLLLIRRGYKNIEISKLLNVDKSRITIQLNTIVLKLCKQAKKYGYKS